MQRDPVYDWPLELKASQIICAAPQTKGKRIKTCLARMERFFTLDELIRELRTHIFNVTHDIEVDFAELLAWGDPDAVRSPPRTLPYATGGIIPPIITAPAGTAPTVLPPSPSLSWTWTYGGGTGGTGAIAGTIPSFPTGGATVSDGRYYSADGEFHTSSGIGVSGFSGGGGGTAALEVVGDD